VIPTRRTRVVIAYGLGALALGLAHPGAAVGRRARLSGQCPYADAAVRGTPLADLRAAVLCLTNGERNVHGLPSLRNSTRLNRVAQHWTQAMAASRVFGHGPNFALRLSAGGYNWRAAAENIATGYTTPRSVVAAWMRSPEHCRNILSPAFRDMGTGVIAASAGSGPIPPGTWTVDFGLRMTQSAPSGNPAAENGCPYP
jgi:uncharacterized protein YkwD